LQEVGSNDEVRIRLEVDGGASIEGQVLNVSAAEVRLLISDTEKGVSLPVIKAIYVARPHPLRNLMLMGAAIVAGTGGLVVYSTMPWVAIDATDWPEVFGVVAVIGAVTWKLLARSERFQAWWTRWVPLWAP
jgi:hypothetical protein